MKYFKCNIPHRCQDKNVQPILKRFKLSIQALFYEKPTIKHRSFRTAKTKTANNNKEYLTKSIEEQEIQPEQEEGESEATNTQQ